MVELKIETACLGCQLVNGQVPAQVVFENEWIIGILDIVPLNEGHVLLLPKRHYAEITDMNEATSSAMMKASLIMSKLLKNLFQPDGITLLQNGGIFNDLGHVHVHIFPRYVGDGFGWIEPEDRHNNRNRLSDTRKKFINAINNLDH